MTKFCYKGLSRGQLAELGQKGLNSYQGKVRELVKTQDALWIYHTDRLSAFDRYIGMVPFKGQILAKISKFWLQKAAEIMPTHYLTSPHNRIIKAEAMEPVKIEVIVRGYMAGSMARAYAEGHREFCGNTLPEGLKEFHPLPQPIITPTTKAEAYEHDEDTSAERAIQRGIVSAKEWNKIQEMSFKLFKLGQDIYREKGWILVDTKYEFGRTPSGEIKLIDEIHTPDSSRLWVASTYQEHVGSGKAPEMLDKEIVRRFLLSQGFKGEGEVPEVPTEQLSNLARVYLDVAEKLIGEPLLADLDQQPGLPD